MFRLFSRFCAFLFRWEIQGQFPQHLKKYIVAVAPHTSNWDFVVGIIARSILKMRHTHYIGKSALFKPPFGWFFYKTGGYPIDRSAGTDSVQQVVNIINKHDRFILGIAPEGTRKKVNKLKTGFYFIAKGAGIPIVPCGFDYKRRCVVIGEPIELSDDKEADMEKFLSFYRQITPFNLEKGID